MPPLSAINNTLLWATLLWATLLAAGAASQSPAWAELQVPQGVVSNAIKGQGKLVTYDEGNTLQVYSAVTRTWHPISKSPSASVRLFNDCVVVLEPSSCQALSSHTGQCVAVATAGVGALLNPSNQKNDSIILVRSGSQLHAFSAFTGQWTTREVSASYAVTTQRHVAILQDGPLLAAMSAFDGEWHDHNHGSNITGVGADGTVATASSATLNFAFSAHTRTWSTASAMSNETFFRGDDWALWLANGTALAFSGLRGAFVADTSGATAITGSTDLYALLTTPTGLRAFSAVTGDLISIPGSPNAVDLGGAAALIHYGAATIGYSPLRQQVASLPIAATASAASNSVAYATDAAGQSFAWSSLTASWHQAPAPTTGSAPALSTTTIGFLTPTNAYAFAARSGLFIAHGAPLLGLTSNPTSAPLVGHDATQHVAFDTDGERWTASPRTSTSAPTFKIWRTSALVIDGTTAHGFGAQAAVWHPRDLGPSPNNAVANSEVAFVYSSHQIAACSMLPEIVAFQQFPHFRRVQPRGAPVSFAAAPEDAAFAIAAIAPPAAPTTIPGLGTLLLDASQAVLIPIAPTAKRPVVQVTLQLPADLVLSGSVLASQLLVLPTTAMPYVSSRATVSIW